MVANDAGRQAAALVPAACAGWLAYVVIDFLTHAVFLAPWWRATGSYWLQPIELFRQIPFAYLAFAIYVICVMWLVVRLIGPRPAPARTLWFGAVAGIAFGSTSVLAQYSVFPVPVSAMLVWPVSVTIASVAAVAAGASTLNAERPWRRLVVILLGAMVVLAAGVLLQNVLGGEPGDGATA